MSTDGWSITNEQTYELKCKVKFGDATTNGTFYEDIEAGSLVEWGKYQNSVTGDVYSWIEAIDACEDGIPSSNWYASGSKMADKAFDNNWDTYWETGENGGTGSWIGYDFRTAVHIRRILIAQYSGNYGMSSVKILSSNDSITWTDIGTFALNTGTEDYQALVLNPSGEARFWRIYGNSTLSYHWRVREIEMREMPDIVSITSGQNLASLIPPRIKKIRLFHQLYSTVDVPNPIVKYREISWVGSPY
jgi:hypothetical protein